MLRSLLIGLDGSPYSETAVELGVRWAKQFDAVLVGLGIVDEPTIRKPAGLMIGGGHYKPIVDEQHLAEARRKVEEFLTRFAERCTAEHVSARVFKEVGLPHEEILEEAQRYDAIVLGKQSYFHFETQEGPDETLFQVLRHAPRPVITVPLSLPQSESILLAYDGSLQAARAAQALAFTGLCQGRAVHVLTIDQDAERGETTAARASEYLGSHGIVAERRVLTVDQDDGTTVLQQAAALDAGLIVMGAYGKPAIQEFFFGSTTRKVLKDATVPLLLYH
jgi:nucleotide-binding universal stress UspA family protein